MKQLHPLGALKHVLLEKKKTSNEGFVIDAFAEKYNGAHIPENPRIKIRNFDDESLVDYSLVLLKGELVSKTDCCIQETTLKILLESSNRTKRYRTAVVNKKFKCLAGLQIGENKITLTSCCDTIVLTLHHLLRDTAYNVIPLYIVCSEDSDYGHFQAPNIESNSPESAVCRINTVSRLIQCLMAEKLYELGFGRKTYRLENCIVFRTINTIQATRYMSPQELWMNIGREIVTSPIYSSTTKYVGFLSSTRYDGRNYSENVQFTHEYMLSMTSGYVALGGAQLALFGTGCLYTWPECVDDIVWRFEDDRTVDRRQLMDDSCYRNTYGACFATTAGSVLHELCHTFDLGHTDKGIMGRGFDNIQKVFLQEKESIDSVNANLKRMYRKPLTNGEFDEQCEDKTYFSNSNAALLSYHKWFNPCVPSTRNYSIKFDSIACIVRATAGIRVIELRHILSELVICDWFFKEKVLRYIFQIPKESVSGLRGKKILLVVEDNAGNVLKEEICIP